MHNLFLGLVQYHFRSLIVIDKQASKELRKGQQSHVNLKDLQKGRETLMLNPTMSTMNRLHVKVLEALVQEYEVVLPDTPRPRKKEIIKALLVIPECAPMDVDFGESQLGVYDQAFIANGLVEECAAQRKLAKDGLNGSEVLSDNEINSIQERLGSVQRPSWNRGLPKNVGDAEHGKLKAEQWKSSIEFDLPVALMQLWGSEDTADDANDDHKSQWQEYIKAYLECIKVIFPHHSWHPNHHAALHIHEFLLSEIWSYAWVVDVSIREDHRCAPKNEYQLQDRRTREDNAGDVLCSRKH
ncbi:hypothetical protein BDR06DRAFT_1067718 [Suillus hirtellus]|nr:hypothetical protein BDR06DRAFT_1067718 [Suillus hirtellus]